MTTYSLDAESFINEIKKYRELWDVGIDGNKFKTKDKLYAWANVAKVFIPDFDKMKDIEKSEVYRKLNSKWRNLRDAYVRNLRRKDGKRNYMYAKQLSFLNSRYNNQSTDEDSTDDEKQLKSRSLEGATNSDEDTSTIVNLKRRRVERKEAIEFVDTPSVQTVDIAGVQAVDTSYVAEDEDRSFFDSLLPAVRQFDLDQKLEFRCNVLKLIKHIRSKIPDFKKEFNPVDYGDGSF